MFAVKHTVIQSYISHLTGLLCKFTDKHTVIHSSLDRFTLQVYSQTSSHTVIHNSHHRFTMQVYRQTYSHKVIHNSLDRFIQKVYIRPPNSIAVNLTTLHLLHSTAFYFFSEDRLFHTFSIWATSWAVKYHRRMIFWLGSGMCPTLMPCVIHPLVHPSFVSTSKYEWRSMALTKVSWGRYRNNLSIPTASTSLIFCLSVSSILLCSNPVSFLVWDFGQKFWGDDTIYNKWNLN